ncbi:MAG: hypothetical protein HFH72_08640 [Lachnospiraceae bacterium]|nr:hypothetical protein [Lachnospiraceae bacterium]
MAFRNALGQAISFDCSELIEELKTDIAEFGGDKLIEVVTEEREGVTIYKDYNFISDDESTVFKLSETEKMQRMTTSALLLLYEQESGIL